MELNYKLPDNFKLYDDDSPEDRAEKFVKFNNWLSSLVKQYGLSADLIDIISKMFLEGASIKEIVEYIESLLKVLPKIAEENHKKMIDEKKASRKRPKEQGNDDLER